MKSTRTRACDIPKKVAVWERDGGCCVVCGSRYNVMPNAHYVPRSRGGLGIEENVVTLCTNLTENQCHYKFDYGTAEERSAIGKKISKYLRSHYPGWSEDKLVYRK